MHVEHNKTMQTAHAHEVTSLKLHAFSKKVFLFLVVSKLIAHGSPCEI